MIIGLGTGALYKLVDPSSNETIRIIRETGANAIELCGVLKERFDESNGSNFFNIEPKELEDFSYVSLHAPVNFTYRKDLETKELLDKINRLCEKLEIKLVVFHPNNVEDFSIFDAYDFPIAFENMDFRKRTMTSSSELKEIFSNDKFGFVLDLTHAYTNDASGKLAKELLNNFRGKVKQVHCSGYFIHGKDEQQHFPAHLESKNWGRDSDLPHEVILSDIPDGVPIIIESVFPDETVGRVEPLKKELEFITDFIKS